ncbi:MAG: DUF5106 domain-containing protein [Bacteroidales bacterium]
MKIKINYPNQSFDSLYLKSYNGKDQYVKTCAIKYDSKTCFKNVKPLPPGLYLIAADSIPLTEIILSSSKNQKFTLEISDSSVQFLNSAENSANRSYIQQMQEYEKGLIELDNEFKELQRGGLPSYMMQIAVDSMMAKGTVINEKKAAFQKQIITENKGTLLASIISASIEVPSPPQEYYQNRILFQRYFAEHFFDHYPWADDRLLETPIALNKFNQFARLMYQMDEIEADTFLINALNKSKVSQKGYRFFFDHLEKTLGSVISNYRVEGLYIKMLKDALQMPNLEAAHRLRYEKELSIIDKNLKGSKVPNFNILMSNGDSTTLYDIQSDFILLYLQNPDCPTCSEARERLATYQIMNDAIARNKITVLTIYFEKDENLWKKYLATKANPRYQHGWNYDLRIEEENLFDIRTIPYMFLLDKDKKVIKKDILINEIEDYVKYYVK